ncbi:PREDICTED: F-BAR and double SH3 domains protein 2 isoform X2 [Nicrophorus vespilloides]|uniref:F-BAR and double SH3 domains protein 2 isoform X2 n=1 Tax=Nicrophorus vespilloides TaxID=110193 RepID=A0ABM1N2R0_NICVS|nr:PREDICTED: F-BAR and double SH3 domains protein 2 isoform X2 [Nicrophorus vespilloides]
MQPPPRKGNYAKFLKNLHQEQIAKLLAKNQHECDLLEDIRTFIIKRCAIERSYSDALLKISSAYLNKKIPNIPDIKLDGGDEKWNMWNVWRTVLEENEKLARARLAAVEVFQQQIAEESKVLRSHKLAAARRCVEQLSMVHKELQLSVQDVDKTKKLYFDEEHCAHDVRDKARDIEEKLKKKKGSFFQSITSLQKNSAKFSSKREQLEEKSAGARNDYLLCLAAANAHQNRYFVVDLQLAMTTMESNVFDKVAEFLTLMGRTELLTCSAMQNSFSTIRDQAKQLTREYNLQCIYLYYPVLKQHIQYDYEPCDNDPVELITAEHDAAAATLSKEARRWATKIARENNNVRDCVRKLQIYNALRESGQRVDPNDQNGPDLETKIEDMKQSIRRSETSKMKAEARIEYLRAGGVNVDEWLQEAETLNVQDIQRSASSLSDHPSSDSFYDSDFADGEPSVPPTIDVKIEKDFDERTIDDEEESQEVDAILEQERQRIEQLTAGWDDPTQVDWGNEDADASDGMQMETISSATSLKCTALYSYTAQNPDELTIVENEQLEVVGEGDGDGWLKARNYRGEEGYVPHNYLDVEREQSATTPGLVTQISFSSVDYTIDNEDETTQNTDTANQSPDQVSVIAAPALTSEPSEDHFQGRVEYCCALYDYDGEGAEELSFEEGQVIRIVSKCAHSIDDGWWKGELDGIIGNFPSLVVEECDEYGEPLSNLEDLTPPCSAPPVFTPPDVPEFLIASDIIITDATPMFDGPPSSEPPKMEPPKPPPQAFSKFSMELTRNQHDHYGSQFDDEDETGTPTVDVPSVVIADECGQEVVEGRPTHQQVEDDLGLGVAQIVITAATPMIEEPEQPFPPPEPEPETAPETNHQQPEGPEELAAVIEEEEEEEEEEPEPDEDKRTMSVDLEQDQPTDSAPFPISSSSDGDTTGPSTAENSVSHAPPQPQEEPKQVVGGRASIPDELEPHQLARLQDLKESNA